MIEQPPLAESDRPVYTANIEINPELPESERVHVEKMVTDAFAYSARMQGKDKVEHRFFHGVYQVAFFGAQAEDFIRYLQLQHRVSVDRRPGKPNYMYIVDIFQDDIHQKLLLSVRVSFEDDNEPGDTPPLGSPAITPPEDVS